jgi:hypothetical protein
MLRPTPGRKLDVRALNSSAAEPPALPQRYALYPRRASLNIICNGHDKLAVRLSKRLAATEKSWP